jgi:ADP-heptose:LPS heptosyltransferase
MKNKNVVIKFREFKNKRINSSYFNIFKEVPLLIKLNLEKKDKIYSKNPRSTLIINTCLIGDFIASLPALKYFIDKNKVCVDLVVSPIVEPLAKKIKGVKRVFTARSVYNRSIEKRRNSKAICGCYDFVLVMRLSEEAYELMRNIRYKKIKTYLGPYLRYGLHLLGNLSNKETIKQWSEINFETIKERRLNNQTLNFDETFKFSKPDFHKIDKFKFLKEDKRRIVIHTGSGWSIKLWSNQNWAKLLKRIHQLGEFQFIFIGGTEEEEEHFNFIKKQLDFNVYSTIKKLDLKEMALLMKKCDYFIGVDSGPRHIAHLIDLPSVCLLGPGPKNFKPLNKNAIIIDKSNCKCTNLFCYRKKTCMEKISVGEVFNKFRKFIKYKVKYVLV